MFQRFKGKDRKIIVALKEVEGNDDFIKSVISIASRTNMRLCFTTVIEPRNTNVAIYPGEYINASIQKLAEKKAIKDKTKQLNDQIKPYRQEFEDIEIKVLAGNAAECINAEAVSSAASLIISGVKQSSHRFIPKGFSTAISLMANSSIPVIAIPEGKFFDFNNKKVRIVVADDLSPTSSEVLPTCAELAGSFENTEIIHTHIHHETKEDLMSWADDISEMMITKGIDHSFPISRETVVLDMEEGIKQTMINRLEIPTSYLMKNEVQYNQHVSFGEVFEEMSRLVEDKKPQLIAFGKHHFLHKHPISIGRVPFHTMLSFKTPVLIASNAARLT